MCRTRCRAGAGTQNLEPLGVAGQATHLTLAAASAPAGRSPDHVTLFDQGLIQVLEAAVTGLAPKQPLCAGSRRRSRMAAGALQPLRSFMTNPAGAAIVNAIGPIRQIVESGGNAERRYLVIVPAGGAQPAAPAQVQVLLTNGRPPSITASPRWRTASSPNSPSDPRR